MRNNKLTLGLKKSEEERKAISERTKGNKNSAGRVYATSSETKAKISKANKGKKSWLGKHHSIETRLKMSLAKIGNKNRSKNANSD